MRTRPGRPYPLGATFDGGGTNFALFSEVADRVELCLLDDEGTETRVEVTESTAHVWHVHVPGVEPGQRYGFRVHGPYDPARGHRCNPAKLLLDPYAKAVDGMIDSSDVLLSYTRDASGTVLDDADHLDPRDSAPHTMYSVVVNPFYDWGHDRPPRHGYHETVLYEAHARGLTMTHPAVPENLRGTYAGLAHPAVVAYLTDLGVTAVELMPVHQFVDDPVLRDRGLTNYWGYNTIGFLAPHNAYASSGTRGQQVHEFKTMVKTLHEAGIEVILDVVYNHTAEGNHLGPTLSFRGIDNAAYYRLVDDSPAHYFDTTGTGNSLLMRSPHVLQLIMDSLRYWVTEMHVDGFRFDLAATLARQFHEVDRLSAFFDLVQQDPVISQVKLIAEPWDLGDGGYQVGGFPPLWTEWNGLYRDTVRDFWRGQPSTLPEFASRLTGSSDLYESTGRRPAASVNFVTAHDGFTLADLVSYDHKHNEANGEDGRDGESHNRSWNHGVEGPTDDPAIRALRARQQRNFLATLLLSQGVPMLSHGDEIGRTQGGNNNVYCQDGPTSWLDWDLDDDARSLLAVTQRLVALRREHPVLRRRRFLTGRPPESLPDGAEVLPDALPDVVWFDTSGDVMDQADWDASFARTVGVLLEGEAITEPDDAGGRIVDDSVLILFNAFSEDVTFRVPAASYGPLWGLELRTDDPEATDVRRPGSAPAPAAGATPAAAAARSGAVAAGEEIVVTSRSLVVLLRPPLRARVVPLPHAPRSASADG
ncbi:glycogen debranching protein GlgX [Flavimobilis sp. GY10621]|uniref:Glycogen debranching protein GlgX n=1 Tax=Flavimobilis rhizosphaerae TaxID=2775421 RepID=A0ABR9DTD6_9MICO|nr:glycogen debranching protein GlgX [Flavimobilis rhizosphaerae]MBD9700328.1 glycogen debranching protein GlgX [Flavimobilis rhizosphaerae]